MGKAGGLVAAVILALSACGGAPRDGGPAETSGDRGGAQAITERTAAIYAAVLRQLITRDHTFGSAPPPFKRVYVIDGAVANASDPGLPADRVAGARFPARLKSRIVRRLTDLPPIEFVMDYRDVLVDRKNCPRVKADGVLVTLGPISRGARRVAVPSGLFFNCRGGQWLTYVLERREDGEWDVVGTKGPLAIS
jgi:hypothetical protein